jgi:hypothetical protein
MSWVANLMVQADSADAGVVQRLNEWLQTAPRRDGTFGPRGVGSLRSLTNPLNHTWGGWKNLDQEESYFRLYMFRDGRLQQFAPPPPPDADDQHAW